jgi:hypoxanthine-guanine phosphoribosyltransferase
VSHTLETVRDRLEDEAARAVSGVVLLFKDHRENRRNTMATVTDVQDAFNNYVNAVNAKLSDLQAQVAAGAVDLDPLAQDIAAAATALNPPPAEAA